MEAGSVERRLGRAPPIQLGQPGHAQSERVHDPVLGSPAVVLVAHHVVELRRRSQTRVHRVPAGSAGDLAMPIVPREFAKELARRRVRRGRPRRQCRVRFPGAVREIRLRRPQRRQQDAGESRTRFRSDHGVLRTVPRDVVRSLGKGRVPVRVSDPDRNRPIVNEYIP